MGLDSLLSIPKKRGFWVHKENNNEPIISTSSGFTQEYLNNKTFYAVMDWTGDEDGTWVLSQEEFKNSTTHEYSVLLPVANQEGLETETYSITSIGSLQINVSDGAFYWHVMAIDDDKLTLCATQSNTKPSTCTGSNVTDYFFFDQTRAEVFFNSL